MADWAKSVRQEAEQEVGQSLVCLQLLCLPYQLCSNQLLKLTKHRIGVNEDSAVNNKECHHVLSVSSQCRGSGVFSLACIISMC